MEHTKIEARPREPGTSNAARRLRSEGKLPAVVYGGDGEARPIEVDPREVVDVLKAKGLNTIIELDLEGEEEPDTVMIQDYQIDALATELLHADFLRISLTDKSEFEVPVKLVGEAEGVKEGGVLDHVLRTLTVSCLPTDIPDHVEADISHLEINDALHVGALEVPGDVEVLDDLKRTVVAIHPPMSEEDIEGEEEDLLGLGVEPELIRPEREAELAEGEELTEEQLAELAEAREEEEEEEDGEDEMPPDYM